MNKVLVFGGTGFIGSHVVEALTATGADVTTVVREGSNTAYLETLKVNITKIPQFIERNLLEVIKGHELVYNCTADVRLHKSLPTYRTTQVELTETLARAAAKANCIRFIQLSTVEVYGTTPEHFIDEDFSCNPVFPFQQSCLEREQVLQQTALETGLEYTILRPSATFGRRNPLMGLLLGSHQKGRFPVIGGGDTGLSVVDTRDIGRAMAYIGELSEAAGEIYLLTGKETSMKEIKTVFDQQSGRKSKLQNLPTGFARLLASVMERVAPYSIDLPFTRFAIHAMTTPLLVNDSKLRSTGFKNCFTLEDSIAHVLRHAYEDYGLKKELDTTAIQYTLP